MIDPLSRGAARQTFLARVRRSLEAAPPPETRPPAAPPTAEVSSTLDERVQRFATEARAADATVTRVASIAELRSHVATMVSARRTQVIVRGDTPLLHDADLDSALRDAGVSVFVADLAAQESRDGLRRVTERAQIGLTEADWGIAESGTLALLHRPGQGRALSVLPEIHLAVLPVSRLVDDLAAFFAGVAAETPPSALTFVTGPSRTADIEMVITRGVHGPREVHVILLDDQLDEADGSA